MSILTSICDGFCPAILRRDIEKTRLLREEMDGKKFISHQSRHSSSDVYSYNYFFLYLVAWPGVWTIVFTDKQTV